MSRPRKKHLQSEGLGATSAVIYARVSTKEQEDGFSLDAQLSLLRSYAFGNGMEIVAEYVEAETAKAAGRSEFGKMVRELAGGSAKAIIVEKTDRIYRNLKDRVIVDDLGVELHLVKEGTVLSKDSKSHEKFVHDVKLVMAKNFIDNLSEEIRKGMSEKAKQGIWPSMAPVGYLNVRQGHQTIIIPDPEQAHLVRRLFEAYATGEHSVKTCGKLGL